MEVIEEKKSKHKIPKTIALAETEKVLYFDQSLDGDDIHKLIPNKKLQDSLKEFDIPIVAFGCFDSEILEKHHQSNKIPLSTFFKKNELNFLTKYDAYGADHDQLLVTSTQTSLGSWKECYELHYQRYSNYTFFIAAARDLCFKVFADIRYVQLGMLDINSFPRSNSKDFDLSLKELNNIISDEGEFAAQFRDKAKFWKNKLTTLSEQLFEKSSVNKKFDTFDAIIEHFKDFFQEEFAAVAVWNKRPLEYKGKIPSYKGDILTFALFNLQKQGVANVVIFEKTMKEAMQAEDIYKAYCAVHEEAPSLVVYWVNAVSDEEDEEDEENPQELDVSYSYQLVYQSDNFPKDECENLREKLAGTRLTEAEKQELRTKYQQDENSRAEKLKNERLLEKKPHVSEAENSSKLKNSALITTGVLSSLSFVGSFLDKNQNEKLFSGLFEGGREDFIASLMTSCQNAPGNYASYVSGTVLLLLLLYYTREPIKKIINDVKENISLFQPRNSS